MMHGCWYPSRSAEQRDVNRKIGAMKSLNPVHGALEGLNLTESFIIIMSVSIIDRKNGFSDASQVGSSVKCKVECITSSQVKTRQTSQSVSIQNTNCLVKRAALNSRRMSGL